MYHTDRHFHHADIGLEGTEKAQGTSLEPCETEK